MIVVSSYVWMVFQEAADKGRCGLWIANMKYVALVCVIMTTRTM